MTKPTEELSIISLYNLLTSVASGESTLPSNILSRQSSLADYTDTALGISKTSLNTLKSRANTFIPGGFKELDNQRRKALASIKIRPTKNTNGTRRTRLNLEHKIASLKKDVTLLEEDLITLSAALEFALSRSTHYLADTNNKLLIERWQRERKEILLKLSLRNRFRQTVKPQ